MESKKAIDKIINKSRVHLYKPIQIAEILYRYRINGDLDPEDIESYRNRSKKWRDDISKRLVGRVSTSSQKFQDNLFEENAMPPHFLKELAEFNKDKEGIVENYIYHKLKDRLSMVFNALQFLKGASAETFNLKDFLSLFTTSAGLKRSIDKVYEITVYALFSTIVRALKVEVKLSIENADKDIMSDFEKFIDLVLGLSSDSPSKIHTAMLYRVGVTNAADRGLDMWANFGPAIQVKHVTLSEELAEDVTENITADKIILVCLDAEAELIERVLSQLQFSERMQGIITLSDLQEWYKICVSEKHKEKLGDQLLKDLEQEFNSEFPANTEIEPFLSARDYDSALLTAEWSI